MMKYELKMNFKRYNGEESEIIHKFEAVSLDALVENVEGFIRGCGFHFKELEIVDDIEESHIQEFEETLDKRREVLDDIINEEDEDDFEGVLI